MNKSRRNKRRRKARQHKHNATLAENSWVSVEVSDLEIARGHDGFLRGTPEPVLVCAVFSLQNGTGRLVARGIGHFDNPKEFPCVVRASESKLARGRRCGARSEPIVTLIVAMEEDSGADIQRLYAALEHEDALQFLETSDAPRALYLEDILSNASEWQQPHDVDLVVNGKRFDESCSMDKWIAAGVFSVAGRSLQRVHLVSADERNDWTALVAVR